MFDKEIGDSVEQIDIRFVFQIMIAEGDPVDPPGLPPGPGRIVPVALMGHAVSRLPRLHIDKICMIGRIVLSQDTLHGSPDMILGHLCIALLAGHLTGPVENGQIQQAVDDQPVLRRFPHISPCLKELSVFPISFRQMIRRLERRFLPLFAAGQLISRHTGEAEQKSHIMMVHIDFIPDPFQKTVHLHQSRLPENLILCILIGQPDSPCPEPCGPLHIVRGLVKPVKTVG